MSSSLKWIAILLVLCIAGGALWYFGFFTKPEAAPTETQTATTTPAVAQQEAPSSGLPTSDTDDSDAAISQDEAAIDTQISAYGSDTTAVDQSMQDEQVQQAY